jgi:hypothetical protein
MAGCWPCTRVCARGEARHPRPSHSLSQAIASTPNIAKHLHMPAQSGSTTMLERMRRCAPGSGVGWSAGMEQAGPVPAPREHAHAPQCQACWAPPSPVCPHPPGATRARRMTPWSPRRAPPSRAWRCRRTSYAVRVGRRVAGPPVTGCSLSGRPCAPAVRSRPTPAAAPPRRPPPPAARLLRRERGGARRHAGPAAGHALRQRFPVCLQQVSQEPSRGCQGHVWAHPAPLAAQASGVNLGSSALRRATWQERSSLKPRAPPALPRRRDKTHAARHYADDVHEDVKARRLQEVRRSVPTAPARCPRRGRAMAVPRGPASVASSVLCTSCLHAHISRPLHPIPT